MWDPDFREPVGSVKYQAPVTVRAQVRWERNQALNMAPGGDSPVTELVLTMVADEFRAAGGFGKGDHVTSIAGDPVDAYVTEVRPAGQDAHGKNNLVQLICESRRSG